MPSPEHEAIVTALVDRPVPETPPTMEESRAGFEAMTAGFTVPDDVRVESVDAGGVPGAWVAAPGARDDVAVLYLHGGGYILGSVKTHTELASRISRASAVSVLSETGSNDSILHFVNQTEMHSHPVHARK